MKNLIFTILFLTIGLEAVAQGNSNGNNGNGQTKKDSTKNEKDQISTQNYAHIPFSPVEPFRKMKSPPSPQMASLGQFGEIPVNHSTGIANVTIPIHTINVNGYEHSISLNYHGGGIKVNQVSSNVGLGWVLNASGVLATTANKIGGDFIYLPTNYTSFNPNTNPSSFPASRNDTDYMWAHDALNNCYDTEPDVINYNFGNYSGVMVPIYQGSYREVPYKGLSIQNNGSSFVIFDKEGTKFTFDVEETTYIPPGCPNSLYMATEGCVNAGIYNDSYYLSKIESKEGGIINFFYENESYTYAVNRTEQKYSWVFGGGCVADSNLPDVHCIQESTVTGKRLIRIETSENEQILFKYKTEATSDGTREDLPGSKALQFIEVFNMGEALPLKKVELFTSYHFGSGSTGLYHNVAWEKRLKLDQVIFDSDHNYSFSYFGNLASRLSFDQDFYGYHIYSSVSTLTPFHPNHNPSGADRSPNPSRINAGLLEIITFPTGGYNRFEYEPNWVFFGNSNQQGPGVRIKRISSYSDLNSLVKFTDYKYVQENGSISSGFIDNLQSSVNFIDEQSQWQHDNDTGPYRLDCKFYVVSSDDQLSSFMGRTYNITYKRVEEIINDGSQGKIVYHFSQINDVIINTAPSLSNINYDWTHGLPIKTEIFKKEGSSFEKIEEKTFHYKTFITNTNSFQANAGPSSFYSFGMKLNRERAEVQPGQHWLFKPAVYNLFKYGYLSALLSKYKETNKLYKNGLTRETNIYFSVDSLNNQITKSVYKDINNPSNTMIRYYFYSDEINSQSAFFIYKNPLLFIDKKVYNGVEYTINGGYFPMISLNGRLLHNKAYRLDLAQPVSNYTLNLNQPELSQGFKLTNEVLNFNSKNYPELIKDNGIQTKIFYDYSDLKPTAYIRNFTGTNSDFAYTSFETNNQGGWNYTVLSRPIRITPFTGSIVHRLSGNPLTKNNLNQSRTYVLTFAVKKDGNAIPNLVVKKNGSIISDSGISNSDIGEKWIIYQYRLSSCSSVQIEGDGVLIDELRIFPIESSITTYGYFPFIGLSYENPNSMIPVNYFYNGQRRLSMILNQNGERLKQYFYQYKAPISF